MKRLTTTDSKMKVSTLSKNVIVISQDGKVTVAADKKYYAF